ncbi:MAG TPA: M20/M25/M40 family metallo-hydrolase [Prosthecobacter sp.]|nr:M20/M25/M40 family metallo-hydrolase [Prosthecobacter sp.]HRK16820.1 M20/M25/M40 family metallo-hydrolase [Prosthecobacter sp.]
MNPLHAAAEHHLPECLCWLRRMVEINSFTTRVEGITALGRLTAECFAGLGFEAEFAAPANLAHGSHLFLRRGTGRPVVLVTHLDTVFPPEEEQRHAFHWQEENGRIYGPGTVDNKGGTALIWLMLQTLRDTDPALFEQTPWLVAANSAEEVVGSDFADQTRARCPGGARIVLVFEGGPRDASGSHLVTARKGRLEYRLECSGRAAHAGSSFAEGVNAVVELAALLPRLAALSAPGKDLTVNVANISGGTVLNRVPHEAAAELEIRAFDPEVLHQAGQAVEALAGRTPGGAEIRVTRLGHTLAWPGGPDTDRLFEAWQHAGQTLGMSVLPMRRGGLSDANYLHTLAPTLDGLGPAGANAHCSERSADGAKLPEYVETASFVPKAALNVLALGSLLRR